MKLKCLTITLAALVISCGGETDKKVESQDQIADVLDAEVKVIEHFDETACDLSVTFKTKPTNRNQVLKLDDKSSLEMNQYLASKGSSMGPKIATNVICQKLVGERNYQASDEEFAGFIQQALEGLKRSGAKDLKLELTGDESYVYQGALPTKEYLISGNIKGSEQVFHNIVLIDKNTNIAYSISVSGSHMAGEEIKSEFVQVVENMVFKNGAS